MAGVYQYEIELKSNVAKLLTDMKEVQDRLGSVEGREYKVNLGIDSKKLENVISNLDKMLTRLGRGTSDFKEFENLSKQLNTIVSEVQALNKEFGKINDSGISSLVSSIRNIDSSLTSLREHIVGVNKDFGNIGKNAGNNTSQINEAKKATEGLANATNELADAQKSVGNKSNISSGMKDVFQGEQLKEASSSARVLEDNIENISNATSKASQALDEYKNKWKILSQVGEATDDSFSATYEKNKGQIEVLKWKARKDEDGNYVYDENGDKQYDTTSTIISNYQKLEKEIISADNALRKLEADKAKITQLNPNASTSFIQSQINDQKEYISLLEQTITYITDVKKEIEKEDGTNSFENAYLIDPEAIQEARLRAKREYELAVGSKGEMTSAKQSASDEKRRLANIEQVNRALNRQQIIIDSIEKTYDKTKNKDLDRAVSNNNDLAELARKKSEIQELINKLNGQERTSTNESEFLKLDKLISEYKELAKYKLKANNPSKQELGGQNLQTLIEQQIPLYDKLIVKAEKYGDKTSETVEKLKEYRRILSATDKNGKFTATADDYYKSRDNYKVEAASLSAYEAKSKAFSDLWEEANKVNNALNETRDIMFSLGRMPELGSQFSTLESKILKLNNRLTSGTDNFSVSDYKNEVKSLTSEYSKLVNIQQKRDVETYDQNTKVAKQEAKSLLEVERQITKETEQQTAAQQKKWQSFQNEQQNYISGKQETEAADRNARAYQNLVDTIQKYSEVKKRIAKNEALDGDVELAERLESKISELQNQPILSSSQISRSEKELEKLYEQLDKIENKTKEKDRQSKLSPIQSLINTSNGNYEKWSTKPTDQNRSVEYQQALDKYKGLITSLREELKRLSNIPIINDEELKKSQELADSIKNSEKVIKSFSASQKGSTSLSRGKTIEWANDLLKQNSKWSKAAKQEVQGWIDVLATADPSNVEQIRDKILGVVRAEREAGREGKSFLDIFKNKALYGFASQLAMYYLSFYDFVRYARNAINAVKDYDDGLTKMSYTMDLTKRQFDDLGKSVLNMSSDMKTSIDDAMSVAQIYANMNTTAEEISRLSQPTLILSNLTGFDAETVANDIQAVTQQFDIAAEDSMHIADVYDYISRNISVDYSKLLELILETI